ncbi:MAG: glucose-1-phosphate adenylyltransferase subunit GlgD [Sporolactobacillus sp.]
MRKNKLCGILNLTESRKATYPLTRVRPLAALPFCCRYRMIDLPLTNMTTAGIDTIGIFCKGSLRSIYDHIHSGSEWGLDSVHGGLFFFSSDTEEPQPAHFFAEHDGDIYNYYQNLEFIEKSEAEYVVIMGTCTLCNVDIQSILRSHIEQGAEITVVYKSVDELTEPDQQMSCMTIDEDGIVRGLRSGITQPRGEKSFINMEIYLIKSSLFTKLVRNVVAENEHCNLNDVLHQAIVKLKTNGFEYTGYSKNINSIPAYYNANMDMLQDANLTALLKGSQSIHTKVKNEVPTYYSRTSSVSDSLVANGCLLKGEIVHSIVFRNVTIEKNALINSSVIMQGSYVGTGAELHYVILDKQVRIEPNTKLIGTKEKPIVIEKNSVISRIIEGNNIERASSLDLPSSLKNGTSIYSDKRSADFSSK